MAAMHNNSYIVSFVRRTFATWLPLVLFNSIKKFKENVILMYYLTKNRMLQFTEEKS